MRMDGTKVLQATRLAGNPIIWPGMTGLAGKAGQNINGPSLIRVPRWAGDRLGRYYLYFAHHQGQYIRLAYADKLNGPWRIYEGGVLGVADGPGRKHIASPDVHVDEQAKRIRMYFHQPAPTGYEGEAQVSFVAESEDGLHFKVRQTVLGSFYFRVFAYGQWHYALAKQGNIGGKLYRSSDGVSRFEPGPMCLKDVRHTAVWVEGEMLHVLYTRVGEVGAAERIYHRAVQLGADWEHWRWGDEQMLLEPEEPWEGGNLELKTSSWGAVHEPVRQLRDPAVFEEAGQRYLLYSVAGERGIAIAKLDWK